MLLKIDLLHNNINNDNNNIDNNDNNNNLRFLQTPSYHFETYTNELIYFDCNKDIIYDQNTSVEDASMYM